MARPIVTKALQGFNGIIMAYGQTFAGKTYTMVGKKNAPGIVSLAVQDIFKQISELKDQEISMNAGFIEIHNDKVYDLLEKNQKEVELSPCLGLLKTGVRINIKSEEAAMSVCNIGNNNKEIREARAQAEASQSHTIFHVSINSTSESKTKSSNLYLVDLAGSETPDEKCKSFYKALQINKNLFALRKMLQNESRKKYASCSNLTRILSSDLLKHSLIAVICVASPVDGYETFRSLSFAKQIKLSSNKNKRKNLQALRSKNLHSKKSEASASRKRKFEGLQNTSSPKRRKLGETSGQMVQTTDAESSAKQPTEIKNEEIQKNQSEIIVQQKKKIKGLEEELAKTKEEHEKTIQILKEDLKWATHLKEIEHLIGTRNGKCQKVDKIFYEDSRFVRLRVIHKIVQLQDKYFSEISSEKK